VHKPAGRLEIFKYKNQQLHHVTAEDKDVRYAFWCDFSRLEDDVLFTANIVFSDETTVHVSGNVNRHKLRILWEQQFS
jgi:hypothetical protein